MWIWRSAPYRGSTYIKERSTQVIKCSPGGNEIKPSLSCQRKMTEYLMSRQIIVTPFANRSYQPRPKATPIRRYNHYQAQQREALSTEESKCRTLSCSHVEELACHNQGKRSRSHSIQPGLHNYPTSRSTSCSVPYFTLISWYKCCTVCTPLGKLCQNEYTIS